MYLLIMMNLLAFLVLLLLLAQTSYMNWSLTKKVFTGLVMGVLFGVSLQFIYGANSIILQESISWLNIVGSGYVQLLHMVVMPLIFSSILSAVSKLHNVSSLGKISLISIGTLLFTTVIAALVGIFIVHFFDLTAEGLIQGKAETTQLNTIQSKYMSQLTEFSLPELILSFIPKNPFLALASATSTSIISVVIFATFLGVAVLRMIKIDVTRGKSVLAAIDCLQAWVMNLVRLVMLLTPYGVLALMTKIVATTDVHHILKLGHFVIASYIGLGMMFLVHALLLFLSGVDPRKFFRHAWPVLTFAFTSRSSAASIPLNIEVQTHRLGVPESIANFSASFGANIGQNGCSGLYPAMLATMIAPTMGINPLDPLWIATLVAVVTISSVGVAGVGGGATFAALMVLPALGFPVTLVALLISIEPLVDMGRTALNVNGSMSAGVITNQFMKKSTPPS